MEFRSVQMQEVENKGEVKLQRQPSDVSISLSSTDKSSISTNRTEFEEGYQLPDEIAERELKDLEGNVTSFGKLVENRKIVFALLRHFGW